MLLTVVSDSKVHTGKEFDVYTTALLYGLLTACTCIGGLVIV